MIDFDASSMDWDKSGGLVPAIVQDARSGAVLMLGYMNREALAATLQSGRVTFFSRSKNRLWTKGESSGFWLRLTAIHADCDCDSLLVSALPGGPTCHRGTQSCFGDASVPAMGFLGRLDALIDTRERERPADSYTSKLFDAGIRRIAQKVGEEGVEVALAAASGDDAELLDESADLLFHLSVLLRARGKSLADVAAVLATRHTGGA
ncbi:MAG TPA: bifunctional phosphoribosyl-AMP cyclohydrolase/phosphoribosyl-ATP diphosphatase HisIE [Rudaea sp.]|jgi:phosphoribosyl-ATP pyrophosphohydrolase/phosphoribosyl-AMP cyclohydrolase